MNDALQFVLRHENSLLFGVVFAEQIGLPLPAIPVLLAAGALAGAGQAAVAAVIGTVIVASLLADLLWYSLGRLRGIRVLKFLCRISLEPDSCVRRTEDVFARHGAPSLLVAKFIPGLNTAAPPLAGIFGMSLPRFLLYDSLGAAIWAGLGVGLGYLFSNQLEMVAGYALELGGWLTVVLLGGLLLYVAWKYVQRHRCLRQLRVARISPKELKQMLDAGHRVMIVDLRQPLDAKAAPYGIPGAVRLTLEEVEDRHQEVPRDRDIVLYCS